jgi:hypothetical protein
MRYLLYSGKQEYSFNIMKSQTHLNMSSKICIGYDLVTNYNMRVKKWIQLFQLLHLDY